MAYQPSDPVAYEKDLQEYMKERGPNRLKRSKEQEDNMRGDFAKLDKVLSGSGFEQARNILRDNNNQRTTQPADRKPSETQRVAPQPSPSGRSGR